MLSVQCTELINPATNRGLPPNLVVDEPSESDIWKGTDIMIAALQAELGFLANPAGNHVQTAEMGNQALNSLALISARYTLDAVDVLTQISAIHLVALCQALDLRAMNIYFLESFHRAFNEEAHKVFEGLSDDKAWLDHGMDSEKRFVYIIDSLQPTILRSAPSSSETLNALFAWAERCSALALETFNLNREHYINQPDATPFLGPASCRMYRFVRQRLTVPFLQESTISTPEPEMTLSENDSLPNGRMGLRDTPTVGSLMTVVYQSMSNGALHAAVMDCVAEATLEGEP
ncbi:hypothetical protein MMC29_004940 [Sticta canariensis]|nr:hypothetical protein [Sticta canariensis]